MTADKEPSNNRGRTVLVGIRFDIRCRELLSWAIVNVADPGDHVVALHVCKKAGDASDEKILLKNHLDTYKGLCDMKQVKLAGQILIGNSIRKSLVKEAKSCGAVAVVVGTNKPTAIGGLLSVAKYCLKHLPSSIDVLSVYKGRVVFERSSIDHPTIKGLEGVLPRPSLNKYSRQRSSMMDIRPELSDSELSEMAVNSTHLPRPPKEPNNANCGEPTVDKRTSVSHVRSGSISAENSSDQRPGWPLLRKASMPTLSGLEARKMSVVQWVMNLPSRSPTDISSTDHNHHDLSVSIPDSSHSLRRSDFPDSGTSQLIFCDAQEEPGLACEVGPSDFTWFSYDVLKSSTSQFSSENLIGKGGCSQVYKGHFPDGRSVAVKVIRSSREAWKDFSLEIEIVSSLKHKNITPLLGVCVENSKLISVYEFVSKGSLEDFLHDGDKKKGVLPWEARFRIAIGIAEALDYLHSGCSRMVIHRDVKSSNILLSEELEPQLSDFGLAIWCPTNSSSQTCDDVVGTFGYLAPEYFMYGKVSTKIDVYSFGVVLLELLSGKRPIDASKEQESLVMWAQSILENGKVEGILDPNLEGRIDEDQARRMILAATLCLTRAARYRPNMDQMLKLLKGEETIEKWTNSCNKLDQEGYDDEYFDSQDDEVYLDMSMKSHLILALDVDDDLASSHSSTEQSSSCPSSLEDYLRGRWSRSSSFD